jgi:hypothetical protein
MTDINARLISLKKYLDMTYINTILCDSHYNYYNKLSAIVSFPTIVGSALLTILNSSSIDDDKMKYINVAINGLNTIIMTLATQYKLNDRLTIYKNSYTKFNKLQHKIESTINNSQEITDRVLDDIIAEYDNIVNDNPYGYLSSYKKKVINKYSSSKVLPNSLQLEASTIVGELVEIR